MRHRWLLAVLLLLFAMPLTAAAESITQKLEKRAMRHLASAQSQPGAGLSDFNTDGCSGGMSLIWETTADRIPKFRDQFGSYPPWEHCCVAHDRAYWWGDTLRGYEKRKRADESLRQCVIDTGEREAQGLASELKVSENQVEEAFGTAAELIYTAVRVGGGPCSGLGWRWGYGWPQCNPLVNNDDLDWLKTEPGDN